MPQLATITYFVRDARNRSGKVLYHTDIANPFFGFGNFNDPLTDAVEYFQEVGRRIDLTCLGRVSGINMSIDVPLAGVKVSPSALADVEEIARFKFLVSLGTGSTFENTIPAFDHNLFPAEQVRADAVPEMSYLVTLLTNPGAALDWAGGMGGISDNRGNPISDDNPLVLKQFRRR